MTQKESDGKNRNLRRTILKSVPATAFLYSISPLLSAAEQLKVPKQRARKIRKPDEITGLEIPTAHRRVAIKRSTDQRLFGVLNKTLPSSDAEEALARTMADEVSHAITQVAVNPDASFARGSFAARIQPKFRSLPTAKMTQIRNRAEKILKEPVAERRLYFGDFADKGLRAHKADYAGFTTTLRQQVRQAVRAKFNNHRDEIIDFLNAESTLRSGQVDTSAIRQKRARESNTEILDIGEFDKRTVDVSYGLATTITSPDQFLDFKWKTEEPDAKIGVWKVFERPSNRVIASGPAGNAPEGVFRIKFKDFLPETPPDTPLTYHVKVFPFPEPVKPKRGLFQRLRIPEPVGPSSPPAIVKYSKAVEPPTKFDQIFWVYRNIEFYVDWLKMVSDSCEAGTEEFHIGGFVQEYPTSEEREILHESVYIDPDGKQTVDFTGHQSNPRWELQDPNQEVPCVRFSGAEFKCWPKVFTACVWVMEEDDESLGEWLSEIWNANRESLENEIRGAILDQMENFESDFAEFLDDTVLGNIELFTALIQMLVGSFTNVFIGIAMMVIDKFVQGIIGGMENDFHGIAPFVLPLPNNIARYVESLPGNTAPEREDPFAVFGQSPIRGRYVLQQEQSGLLLGPPCLFGGDSPSSDGAVMVGVHWEFTDRQQV